MRRAILSMAFVALVCSSCSERDGEAPAAAAAARGARAARPSPETSRDAGPPAARMFSGTDSVEGAVVRWCEGDECETFRARHERVLQADEASTLVTFGLSAPPLRAVLSVAGKGRSIRAALRPGTLMAYELMLPKGRYTVVLDAAWADTRGRWQFLLRGPLGAGSRDEGS